MSYSQGAGSATNQPDSFPTIANAPAFVHPQYFGLLASCLEEEQVLEETEGEDDHLRHESFNQGYCARFFVEEELLGRGGKAEVVKVRHVLEGMELGVFALKRVAVGDSQAWLLKTLREVQSIRFRHANLVSYNHVWLERRQQKFGPTVPVLHILQEYCDGGDLEAYVLQACGKIEPTIEQMKQRSRRKSQNCEASPKLAGLGIDMIYSFFKDILAGLAFLHEQGLIHRDMKASNCLLDKQAQSNVGIPRILVSDFGEAQFINASDQRSGSTGTLAYTAPEIVRGGAWTAAADMFSLGMILYFLTHSGTLPYHSTDDDFDELRAEICSFGGYAVLGAKTTLKDEDQRELDRVLSDLLSPDPLARPTCSDLLSRMRWIDSQSAAASRPTASPQQNQAPISVEKWPDTHETEQKMVVHNPDQLMIMLPTQCSDNKSKLRVVSHCIDQIDQYNSQHWTETKTILIFLIRSSLLDTISSSSIVRGCLLCAVLAISILEARRNILFSTRLGSSIALLVILRLWAYT